MAIEDTINSIENHLQADYKALENIGADLTGVNKNIENIAQCVNEIYDTLPKTSYGEGTNISLANTLKGKLDYDKTILTGKNLLNYVDLAHYGTYNGMTSTLNADGSITTTGKPSYNYASIMSIRLENYITLEDGAKYTISMGSANSYLYMQINDTNNETSQTSYYSLSSGTSVTFTVHTNHTYLFQIQATTTSNWGNSSRTITNTYQLEKSDSATSFEPFTNGQKVIYDNLLYGDTEQDTLTGKNKLAPTETFDETKADIRYTGINGVYTIKGTSSASGSTTYYDVDNYEIQATDYCHLMNNTSNSAIAFVFNCTDDTNISIAFSSVNRIFSLSSYAGKTIRKIWFYQNNNITVDITFTPMIVTGVSTATSYEPYCGRNSKSKS